MSSPTKGNKTRPVFLDLFAGSGPYFLHVFHGDIGRLRIDRGQAGMDEERRIIKDITCDSVFFRCEKTIYGCHTEYSYGYGYGRA